MDQSALRSFKDFLMQYNKISESCFLQCINHLSDRDLSQDECRCVDLCTKKHVSVNHKVMQVYMEIQPLIVNKRIEDVNKQQAALEQAQKKELESKLTNSIEAEQSSVTSVKGLPSSKEIIEKTSDKIAALGESAKEVIVRTEKL